MESNENSIILTNPYINFSSFPYLKENLENTKINLFKINLKKDIIIYQYSISIEPEINNNKRILQSIKKILNEIYGDLYFIYENNLYSLIDLNYNLTIRKQFDMNDILIYINSSNYIKLNNENLCMEKISKKAIEMLVYDFLKSNPNLELEKIIYFNNNMNNNIEHFPNKEIYYIIDILLFKCIIIKNECFLNISLIKKIWSNYNISLNFLCNYYKTKGLIGKYFRLENDKIKYIVTQIYCIQNYNEEIKKIIKSFRNINNRKNFSQELYYFNKRLDTSTIAKIKKEFFEYLKQENNINEFIDILNSLKEIKTEDKLLKKKYEENGIEIFPIAKTIKSYYIKPSLSINIKYDKNNIQISKPIEINDWLFLYERHNYSEAEKLFYDFLYYSKILNIKINEPEWVELHNKSNIPEDWIKLIRTFFKYKKYQFVLFLIDKNDNLYFQLKKHSLIDRGYISQIVRIHSLKESRNIPQNILIQIIAKLNGTLNKIQFDKKILDLNLMIIGIDSFQSKIKNIFSMVATMDCNFSQFYNKGKFIKRKSNYNNNKTNTDIEKKFNIISDFIEEAINEYYNKNKKFPGGIIIYRKEKKFKENNNFIKREIKEIELRLNGKISGSILSKEKKIIPYYYILINKKTTYQINITEKNNSERSGIMIIDEITNKNNFEFYIHSETNSLLTFYRIVYGNIKCDDIIPKLTFDLCYNYPNFNGPIKIPNVILAAEKLTKIVNEYQKDLNNNLKFGQSYL